MENLVIGSVSNSPVKTLEKNKPKSRFLIKHLTSTLPLNTDQMFKMMSNNNLEILENLDNKIKIPTDKNCGYFSMTKKTKGCYNNRCKGCQIIYRLIKPPLLESDTIELYYGKKKGKKLKVTTSNYFTSNYEENLISKSLNLYLAKDIKSIYCNKTLSKDMSFFSTRNKWFNYIIVSIIMNQVLLKKEIFLSNSFIWSFICRGRITILNLEREYKTIEDLTKNPYYSNYSSPIITKIVNKNLSVSTVENIIKQLVVLLKNLESCFFTHSEASIDFISYSSESVTLKFKERMITFPFKISLNPSCYSSISYDMKRFFFTQKRIKNYGLPIQKLDFYFNGTKNNLKKNKKLNFHEDYENFRITGYKIGNKSEVFLETIRNNGVPLFNKSFDFICFLTSYISDKNFFYTFKEKKEYLKIWKGLWKKEEYSLLMKDIENLKDSQFKSVYSVVKKYYIRFDALEYFIEMM